MKRRIPNIVSRGTVDVLTHLKKIYETELYSVLATVLDGQPFTYIIAYAATPDMKYIIFATPMKSLKFKSILKNNRVSLLIDTRTNTKMDYMGAEAVTAIGRAHPMEPGNDRDDLSEILTARHPELEDFINSAETGLILVEVDKYIHVGEFQSVTEFVPR